MPITKLIFTEISYIFIVSSIEIIHSIDTSYFSAVSTPTSNTNNNKNNVPAAQPKAPKKSSADDLINKYTPNAAATGKARMAGDAVSEIRLGNSDYGSRIGLPPDTMFTADFQDIDGDGIDDRHQPGPGQPREESKPPTATPAAPTSASPTATPNEPRFAGDLANFDSEKYLSLIHI